MKVNFERMMSAKYSAKSEETNGMTVTANVTVEEGRVSHIDGGLVVMPDGVTVASFTINGSKIVTIFGGVDVADEAVMSAINGFIAGAKVTAEKGGEA